MTVRRLLAGLLAVGAAAAVAGGVLGGRQASSPRPSSCRDWLTARDYRAEIDAVRDLVPRFKRAVAAPGLSIAVAADGKLVWSESCGFADARRRIPVRRTTQFRIGSVSKPITAAAAVRLQELGRLDLDARIRRYLPELPGSFTEVTLRQLGGHLGGVRHYQGSEAVNTTHYSTLADSLRVFSSDPLVAVPGERFSYSSYGFNVLGAAIEAAAGVRFPEAVDRVLLRPLHMTSTSVGGPPAGGTRFYEVTEARRAIAAPRIDLSDRYPSGGFLSTAEDLARFASGITDSSFVDNRSQSVLFTSQRTRDGQETGYGFGFELHRSPFGVMAGHTGNVVGGTAFLLIHARTRVAVAVTTNIGYVTAARPPRLTGAPDPPQLALPFIRRVADLRRR